MAWNSLLDDLHAQQDYESFRQGLKTWLFSRFSAIETFVRIALYKSTFTIPYHTVDCCTFLDIGLGVVKPMTATIALQPVVCIAVFS